MKFPVIKSVFQAEAFAAYLIKRVIDFRKKNGFNICSDEIPGKQAKLSPKRKKKLREELDSLENDKERFGQILYAHPLTKHLMETWMVDVKGTGGFGYKGQQDMEGAVEELEQGRKGDFISRQGAISKEVYDVLRKAHFNITDAGGGSGGWHLGIPCTDAESNRLCDFLHWRFIKLIEIGMIRIHKIYWGHPCFYNLRNDGACEEWIKKNGNPEEILIKEGFIK